MSGTSSANSIQLPEPEFDGGVSVERVLHGRRSVRAYGNEPLEIKEISQLVWAAQGISDSRGLRTAPSAGALYPLEIYVVAGDVGNLPSGIYKYNPHDHSLLKRVSGDRRGDLGRAALGQGSVVKAPAVILMCAVYERTMAKYGRRGTRYAHMEAGHSAQNICLQATAAGLNTVVIGAFRDSGVIRAAELAEGERPLYLIPVGR